MPPDPNENNQTSGQTEKGGGDSRDPWSPLAVSLDDLPLAGRDKGGDSGEKTSSGDQKTGSGDQKTGSSEKDAESSDKGENESKEGTETGETGGKPAEGEGEGDSEVIFTAKTGRTFKTVEELGGLYDESSSEGLRLNNELKTKAATADDLSERLKEANQSILSLQEYVGEGGFPGTKSKEELEQMDEEAKMNYYAEKREWKAKVKGFKEKMASAKDDAEKQAKEVKDQVAQAESAMRADTVNYPEFQELAPLREQILSRSSWLGNRPDTPYITYVMAHGLVSLHALKEAKSASRAENKKAAGQAESEGRQTGKHGQTQAKGEARTQKGDKDEGLNNIVKAYKDKSSAF